MNDRFKFRCYNKFQEKMFDVKCMSYINGIVKRIEVQDKERILIFNEWKNNIDNTILMQCTGLKDNNGKFIYEGDIVRFYSPYGHATFEIKWSEEFATFGYEDNETDFSEFGRLYDDARYIEVIGNIYENKELLQEQTNEK